MCVCSRAHVCLAFPLTFDGIVILRVLRYRRLGCRAVEQGGAATRPLPPPPQAGPGAAGAAVASTPTRFSWSPRAAPAARHGSGVSASATPGVGGLRAVAGGVMSVTPRTPVHRWAHEEGSAAGVGVGTRSVTRGDGMGTGAGRGGAVAAAAAVPPGYTYGMVSLVYRRDCVRRAWRAWVASSCLCLCLCLEPVV